MILSVAQLSQDESQKEAEGSDEYPAAEGHYVSDGSLRDARKVSGRGPEQQRRVFALTILIDVLCGLTAVAFHLAVSYAESKLINRAMTAPALVNSVFSPLFQSGDSS